MFGDLEVPLQHTMLFSITDSKNPYVYLFLLFLLLISAFFAGCETAYADSNRHKLKVLADDGKKSAKVALRIIKKFDITIITALIVENVARVTMAYIATIMLINSFGETIGPILATIIITLLVFFIGDTLPKNIAKTNADKWSTRSAFFVYGSIILLFPLSIIFRGLTGFVKLFLNKKDDTAFTEDDFQDAVEEIEEKGAINEEESDIIKNAVDFGDTLVKDVYTKREDIIALDIKQCNKDYVKGFFKKYKYSRIPIYKDTIDNVIGVIHVRVFLKELFNEKKVIVRSIMSKPYFITENDLLDDVFNGFKKHHTHIAIVKDKNNKTIGMVSMEDVLEELVVNINQAEDSKEGAS